MVTASDIGEVRNKRDNAKAFYKPNKFIRGLTSLAIATTIVSGTYILNRFVLNGDFLNYSELYTMDKSAVYTAAVSGLVSGFGLMRRRDERHAERRLESAQRNLDNITQIYVQQETMSNLQYAARNHRHPR